MNVYDYLKHLTVKYRCVNSQNCAPSDPGVNHTLGDALGVKSGKVKKQLKKKIMDEEFKERGFKIR